jgi:hypothetical protein
VKIGETVEFEYLKKLRILKHLFSELFAIKKPGIKPGFSK